MKKQATFYHAGCPVCVDAETQFAGALNPESYAVEIVHLGTAPDRIAEAGVASVPAMVVDGKPFHINFGASLADLKSSG